MALLVWMVTGCTTGFGKSMVKSITSAGDKVVVAIGRNAEQRLDDLKSEQCHCSRLGH